MTRFGLRQPELPLFKTLGFHSEFCIASHPQERTVLKSGGSDHRTPKGRLSRQRFDDLPCKLHMPAHVRQLSAG